MCFLFCESANITALCTFFFEKKVRKKAIQEAHPPEKPPVKSSRRIFSATSALPKQRRERSPNLKVFLIVRGFCICGDGRKARDFLLPLRGTNNVGDGLPVPTHRLLRFTRRAGVAETGGICKCASVCRRRRDGRGRPSPTL